MANGLKRLENLSVRLCSVVLENLCEADLASKNNISTLKLKVKLALNHETLDFLGACDR